MALFESSYKSLLQGVSQQIARERQPGQVSAQENMLSDVVTNVRRRPGAAYRFSLASAGATANNIKTYYTDIAGNLVHVIMNTSTGTITVMDEGYAVLANLQSNYLIAATSKSVQASTVGDELFLLNREKQPAVQGVGTGISPTKRGMAFVVAGAFTKLYTIILTNNGGTATGTYTTPTGAAGGDAALTTPAYIAQKLVESLVAAGSPALSITATRVDAYIYFECSTTYNLTVNSPTGSAYVIASKDSYFTVEGNLPAQLPAAADGWIVRVGDVRTPKYFQYNSSRTAWLECGDWASPLTITNMPIAITKVGAVWQVVTTAFEGRLSGDDTSNPAPRFCTKPITGISSYQGRLVLLSGPQVLMSASNLPRRFFRSTVTGVVDSDTIAVGASANSSAAYEYAVPFQKDLLLFSANYQGLIPAGNTAVTPRTATCLLTSTYNADMSSCPITLGRTLMYPTPRSESFFGVMEMVPSSQVDSQYVSTDSTSHLPKYLGGACRFSVSSSNSGTALFAPSGDPRALIVHEYMWNGDQKVQQAWHRWTMPYDIAGAYFAGALIILVLVNAGKLVGCSIDPRAGVVTFDTSRKPFMDLNCEAVVVNRTLVLPAWMTTFDPAIADKIRLGVRTGPMAGERVGFTRSGNTLTTVPSFANGNVSIGIPYTSAISPSSPVVKDANEVVISTVKTTLLRYVVGTANSAEYNVQVRDTNSLAQTVQDVGTLFWSSNDLQLNKSLYAGESLAVIPCRTNVASTTMLISTDGLGELNVISIEYVLRFNLKIKRMEGKFK